MKLLSIVGARPQFIKAASVCPALRAEHREVLVHTGQHYDYEMSKALFEGLQLPEPDHNLEVGSGTHGEQTGKMLVALERVMIEEGPDLVLIYGDTNSTLAGALAASKLAVPLAHIEAGLRSFVRTMPEEINRVLADHVSDLLFCPTSTAVDNLRRESVVEGVHLVGDVMFDVARDSIQSAERQSKILDDLGLQPKGYLLATVHRSSNTDDPETLRRIVQAFTRADMKLVFPVHPRTRKCLDRSGLGQILENAPNVLMTPPLGYLDFIMLERHAHKILTDSGGIQKEACFHRVPCITLREETEWVETVDMGWNILAGTNEERILEALAADFGRDDSAIVETYMLEGRASERIARILTEWSS